MYSNGMTHAQVTEVWPNLILALGVIGLLILIAFLLSKYVLFPKITEVHENQ